MAKEDLISDINGFVWEMKNNLPLLEKYAKWIKKEKKNIKYDHLRDMRSEFYNMNRYMRHILSDDTVLTLTS